MSPEAKILNFTEDVPTVAFMDGPNTVTQEKLSAEGVDWFVVEAKTKEEILTELETKGANVLIVRSGTEFHSGEGRKKGGTINFTPEEIAERTGVLLVTRAGVGIDNLDFPELAKHGIVSTNTPEASTTSVAEHTLGLMFGLFKKIGMGLTNTQKGEWQKLTGEEMRGKKVAVIGAGRIGVELAALGAAIGLKVECHDPGRVEDYFLPNGYVGTDGSYKKKTDRVDAIKIKKTQEELKHLLQWADVVTVHAPIPGLINRELVEVATTRSGEPGPYFVNTARGGVIDEEAVLDAVESGKARGYGIDTYEKEGNSFADSPTRQRITSMLGEYNILPTHHSAAQTPEAQARIGEESAELAINLIKGRLIGFGVNLENSTSEGVVRAVLVINNTVGSMKRVLDVLEEKGWSADPVGTETDKGNVFGGDHNATEIYALNIRNVMGNARERAKQVEECLHEINDGRILRGSVTAQ